MSDPLPIEADLPQLLQLVSQHNAVVIHAPPGAGKTTRVPVALLDHNLAAGGRIIMLEPRRIAARAAARRMASERQEAVGATVGYRVRFDQKVGPNTRIEVVTEGILLRRLLDDPFLDEIQVVIFDEFHERRLDSDLALAMVRRVQQTVRSDLKLIIMSATLAPEQIAARLDDCAVVQTQGRQYPVRTEYLRRVQRTAVTTLAVQGVERALQQTDGDLLVFLPGVGEIFRTRDELQALARRQDLLVMPLFGDLSAGDQDRVLQPADRRKVVLATNVAETSVTIEGITAVVDSGLARQMQFDTRTGLDRLELVPISRASATQRSGRAGRTEPGYCLRLWEESGQRRRPEFEAAELHRVDLAAAVLRLADWGENDPLSFPWFEQPSGPAIEHARQLLTRLGALDEQGITPLGRSMVRLPVHPRLARLILEGCSWGLPQRAALLAAMLSERDPFRNQRSADIRLRDQNTTAETRSDVLDRLAAVEEFLQTGRAALPHRQVNVSAARTIARTADQLSRLLAELNVSRKSTSCDADEALLRSIAVAWGDRVARRRAPRDLRGRMVGGRGVRLAPASGVRAAEYFACVDVDGKGAEATVRLASEVKLEWLPEGSITEADELFFHPSQQRVVARRRRLLHDLVLEEKAVPVPDGPAAGDVLFEAARPQLTTFLNANAEAQNYLLRVNCLAEWAPELQLPRFDEERLQLVLQRLCVRSRSFNDLRTADWQAALQGMLDWRQTQQVESEAPERIQVPSGNRIRLVYAAGRPPVLAVRIQELFGLEQTPRVAGGRVPVLLHLLAPNMRPQQVTDDLASFWDTTYATVRKELKRRYPRHAWPEDPRSADPVRKRG